MIPFATSQGGALHDVWIVFIRAGIVVYVIVIGLIVFAAWLLAPAQAAVAAPAQAPPRRAQLGAAH